MTRRKQTKPRALKCGDEAGGVAMETASQGDALAPETHKDSESEGDVVAETEAVTGVVEDEIGDYNCESCGAAFVRLTEFMDHRNFDCPAAVGGLVEQPEAPPSALVAALAEAEPSQAVEDEDEASTSGINFPLVAVKVENTDDSLAGPYNCPSCSVAFSRSEDLDSHMLYHESTLMSPKVKVKQESTYQDKDSSMSPCKSEVKDGRLSCTQCDLDLETAEELRQHKLSHENPALYAAEYAVQCLYCGQVCLGQKALAEHVEQSHGKENRCPMCNSCFPLLEVLYQHFESQHLMLPVKSPPQGSSSLMPPAKRPKYSEPDLLSPPLKAKEAKQVVPSSLSCPYCKREGFSSDEVLRLHVSALHEGKYPGASKFAVSRANTCPYCNARYPTQFGLEEHMKLQHAELFTEASFASLIKVPEVGKSPAMTSPRLVTPPPHPYERDPKVFCTQCKMSFTSRYNLAEHMSKVHPSNRNMNGAVATKAEGKSNSVLAQELKELKEQVSRSNSGTPTDKHLEVTQKMPVDTTKDLDNEKENLDTSDDAVSRERGKLLSFLSLSNRYGCTSCSKTFCKPDELQKHLMDIHAHHLYRCALCKEIFDSKVNIQIHFAIKHSDEQKIFGCAVCGDMFTKEHDWVAHVKAAHLSSKSRFRCLFCQEVFPSEMELQVHLTTHQKAFACSICGEAFHVEYLLDKHMEKHQNLIPSPNPFIKHASSPIKSPKLASPNSPKRAPSVNSNHSRSPSAGSLLNQQLTSPSQHYNGDKLSPHENASRVVVTSPASTSTPLPARSTSTPPMPDSLKRDYKSFLGSPSVSLLSSLFTDTSPVKGEQRPALPAEEAVHKCIYCNMAYSTKSELERHVKVHASPSTRKCNICDEVFPSSSSLAEHKLQHCKVVQGNICIICKAAMNTEEQFYSHTQQHGFLGANMQCIVCRQSLTSALELQMHGKHHFHTNYKYLTCCVCLANFDSTENLISKLNSSGKSYYICKPCYHGEKQPIRCSQCSFDCESQAEMDAHMAEHKKKSYQCIKCQQTFATEYEIQLHVASHVMQEGNVHECKICRSKYDSPAKLQCHLIEHSFKGKQYQCYLCGATFDTATSIQSHAIEHGVSARQYACSQCPQKFFFSAELKHHTISHNDLKSRSSKLASLSGSKVNVNKSYPMITKLIVGAEKKTNVKCDQCSKGFAAESDLKVHITKVHGSVKAEETGKQKFPCPQCDREFPSLSALQGHTWVHNSAKREERKKKNLLKSGKQTSSSPVLLGDKGGHPCLICGKLFSKKFNMKVHMKTHNEQNNTTVQCEICLVTFNHIKQLQRHLVSAHGKSTNSLCQICNELFLSAEDLRQHMATNHRLQNSFSEQSAELLEEALRSACGMEEWLGDPIEAVPNNADMEEGTQGTSHKDGEMGDQSDQEDSASLSGTGTGSYTNHETVAGTSLMKAVAIMDSLPASLTYQNGEATSFTYTNGETLNGQTGTLSCEDSQSEDREISGNITVLSNPSEQVTVP